MRPTKECAVILCEGGIFECAKEGLLTEIDAIQKEKEELCARLKHAVSHIRNLGHQFEISTLVDIANMLEAPIETRSKCCDGLIAPCPLHEMRE